MSIRTFCFSLGLLSIISCTKKETAPYFNKFSDPAIVKIYNLQDHRNTKALIPFLKAKEVSHRTTATLAFASIRDTSALPYLLQVAQSDEDAIVRRAAGYSMGQLRDSMAVEGIMKSFHHELDLKNKAVLLEAMGKCANSKVYTFFEEVELQDPELISGLFRGIYRSSLGRKANPKLLILCKNILEENNNDEANFYAIHTLFRSRSELFGLDSSFCQEIIVGSYGSEIKSIAHIWLGRKEQASSKIEESDLNPYATAERWKALSTFSDSDQLSIISAFLDDSSTDKILRTTAAEVLFDSSKAHDMSMSSERLVEYLHSALVSRDMAIQSLACQSIIKNNWNTRAIYGDSIEMLESLQTELKLPEQMETYIDFGRLLAKLKNEIFSNPEIEFNHPIDWSYVKTIPEDQKVLIETTKGNITLDCKVNDAPGSVANFLILVDSGFYDGKYFHRVVPNFVIQGGCPRGDGWGSLDWTQRSEFSNYLNYQKGTAGLASAGNDTEGVQIFITHISTPHLDGRYSIFAQVSEGMEIVDQIAMGDKILKISRISSPKN